eukprot:6916674-Ditylum_brightwellii.AAC.1
MKKENDFSLNGSEKESSTPLKMDVDYANPLHKQFAELWNAVENEKSALSGKEKIQKEEIETLKAKCDEMQRKLKTEEEMKKSHVAEREIIEGKCSTLEKEVDELKMIHTQDESSIKALESEYVRLREMVTSLEMDLKTERTKFENKCTDLQEEMTRSDEDKKIFQEVKDAMEA